MKAIGDALKSTFGVIIDPRTYANIGYVLLAFPLGTAYFVFLVTGISVGLGTLVIWVGIPILMLVLAVSWALAAFERRLTSLMLGEEIGPMSSGTPVETNGSWRGRWQALRAHLGNPVTWTSMFYLLVKFPIGTFTFTVTVTLLATSIGLILAPFFYRISDPWVFTLWSGRVFTFWPVDSMGGAWLATFAGVVLLFVSLHLINGMAKWSGQVARATLEKR
jgi:hypothetical protein